MSFKCVTCYYEEGRLTQQQFWFAVLSTCQFLQCIRIDYVSVGRDLREGGLVQFPRSAEDPLVPREISDMSTSSFAFWRRCQMVRLALIFGLF